jgi:hypothetical protein
LLKQTRTQISPELAALEPDSGTVDRGNRDDRSDQASVIDDLFCQQRNAKHDRDVRHERKLEHVFKE